MSLRGKMWPAFVCVLVTPAIARAASFTVKTGGGGDFTTIQACVDAMSSTGGDTCVVYAGTYAETPNVRAGTATHYNTLSVQQGDTVMVLGAVLNSHTKIDGFYIQNPSAPTAQPCVAITANATDYYVTNNTMYACAEFVREPGSGSNVTHGFIQNNTMSYSCSTSSAPNVCTAMSINGDYHLIENNDISHVSDGPYVDGAHNVLRKNVLHDVNAADCGSNSGNCHIDFMQADANPVGGGQPAQYMLIEGNTVLGMVGSDTHALGLFQAEACNGQCFDAIVRFHVAAHFGSGGILDDNSFVTPPPAAWDNVKAYNNTWVDGNDFAGNQMYGGTDAFTHGSTGGAEINNLFYYPEALTDFNPYSTDTSTVATFSVGHNLAWCTGAMCNLHGKVYGSGLFADDPGNLQQDPKFVGYATNDFRLSAGSPAIGAGTFLTTTVGAPNPGPTSQSLTVADATYFQDGSGIPGVQADWIRIGSSTTVQISSIDYANKVVTLANAVSWSNGAPVYLYKDSSGDVVLGATNPDIGAFPYGIPSSTDGGISDGGVPSDGSTPTGDGSSGEAGGVDGGGDGGAQSGSSSGGGCGCALASAADDGVPWVSGALVVLLAGRRRRGRGARPPRTG